MDVLALKKKIAEAHKLTKDNDELKKQLEERDLRIKELEESQNGNMNVSGESYGGVNELLSKIRDQSHQIQNLERQREIDQEKARELDKQCGH